MGFQVVRRHRLPRPRFLPNRLRRQLLGHYAGSGYVGAQRLRRPCVSQLLLRLARPLREQSAHTSCKGQSCGPVPPSLRVERCLGEAGCLPLHRQRHLQRTRVDQWKRGGIQPGQQAGCPFRYRQIPCQRRQPDCAGDFPLVRRHLSRGPGFLAYERPGEGYLYIFPSESPRRGPARQGGGGRRIRPQREAQFRHTQHRREALGQRGQRRISGQFGRIHPQGWGGAL